MYGNGPEAGKLNQNKTMTFVLCKVGIFSHSKSFFFLLASSLPREESLQQETVDMLICTHKILPNHCMYAINNN